jgi:hypothetical protein
MAIRVNVSQASEAWVAMEHSTSAVSAVEFLLGLSANSETDGNGSAALVARRPGMDKPTAR